jgi:PKD repeat protein
MRACRRRIHGSGTFDLLEARQLLALVLVPESVSTTQLTAFTANVATLIDTTLGASPSDFTASINWGDGTAASSGTVSPGSIPDTFQISGTHIYSQAGDYATAINVSDTSGDHASIAGTADVAALAFPVSVNTIHGAAGTSVPASGPVALFVSPSSTFSSASDFTALIAWGDGQTTVGTVGGGPTAFNITGTHTYSKAGSYTTTVTVVAANGPTSFGQGQANIATPTIYPSTSQPIVTPVSQLFSGTVATFTDPNVSDLASVFTASIAWGDGGTTPGTVTGGNGSFAVQGTYTYLKAGTYSATVTVADQSGNSFTVTDTATVTTTNLSTSAVFLNGGLATISANGPNATLGYTDTDEPTFSGTTVPYAVVALYARLSGVDTTTPLGQAVATASGAWTFTSGPLADGIYTITATVTPPAGSPSGQIPLTDDGRVVLDTVSPIVVKESVVGPGRVVVSFRDDLSGMDTASLLNASNYTFAGPGVTAIHPSNVSLLPAGNLPTDAQSVLLIIKGKHRLLRQIRALRISGTNPVSVAPNVTFNEGVIDNAGNALLGNFHTPANPASGRAAGNYVAKLTFGGFV